jgi:hypothetical protein
MTTLLSELVRCLSQAAARELRDRADGPALSRAEAVALATLHDMSAATLTVGTPPEKLAGATDLASLEELAAFDMKIVETAKALR